IMTVPGPSRDVTSTGALCVPEFLDVKRIFTAYRPGAMIILEPGCAVSIAADNWAASLTNTVCAPATEKPEPHEHAADITASHTRIFTLEF
ncbi:MAG: hypothetical protein Q7N95_02450, partial [Alphaproteobacteria bacterium]|nr:hypothetical protein [Alphaproteobacteria bacterium]